MRALSISVFNMRQIEKEITNWMMDFFDETKSDTQQKSTLPVFLLQPESLLLLFFYLRNVAVNFLRLLNTKLFVKSTVFSKQPAEEAFNVTKEVQQYLITNVDKSGNAAICSGVYTCNKTDDSVFNCVKNKFERGNRIGRVGDSCILFIHEKILCKWILKRAAIHFKKLDTLFSLCLYC